MKTAPEPEVEAKIYTLMEDTRIRGERIAAYVRIAIGLLVGALFLSHIVVFQRFRESILGALFLACLGITVLYSLFLLRFLKRKGYRRAMLFVSSGLDVSMISFNLLVILRYSGDALATMVAFFAVYLLYFPVIALSVRRFDPADAFFCGFLSAAQYMALILILRLSPSLSAKYIAVASDWSGGVVPNEFFKAALLLITGIIAFTLARNQVRRLLQVAGAEGALRVEQATLTRFFESTPEAIVVTDNDTRVLRVNRAFSDLFGYSEEESIGRQIDELISPEELADEAARLSQEASSGERFLLETKRRRKDNTLVDVSILGAPIVYRGEQIAVFGTYRNISEQKRKDRLLQALNQAALAMHGAQTHEQIVEAVSRELEGLGFMWTILLLDESGSWLQVKYLGFLPAADCRTAARFFGKGASYSRRRRGKHTVGGEEAANPLCRGSYVPVGLDSSPLYRLSEPADGKDPESPQIDRSPSGRGGSCHRYAYRALRGSHFRRCRCHNRIRQSAVRFLAENISHRRARDQHRRAQEDTGAAAAGTEDGSSRPAGRGNRP
jgi:PAS domain S-box-containing protein